MGRKEPVLAANAYQSRLLSSRNIKTNIASTPVFHILFLRRIDNWTALSFHAARCSLKSGLYLMLALMLVPRVFPFKTNPITHYPVTCSSRVFSLYLKVTSSIPPLTLAPPISSVPKRRQQQRDMIPLPLPNHECNRHLRIKRLVQPPKIPRHIEFQCPLAHLILPSRGILQPTQDIIQRVDGHVT